MNNLLRAVSDWKGGNHVTNMERYEEGASRTKDLYG